MKYTLTIPKMKCSGCVKTIAETLLLVDGLNNVEVSLENKQVEFDAAGDADVNQARQALTKVGFPPKAAE